MVTLFWRLSRGSSKSHAIAMSSRVDFDDSIAGKSSREPQSRGRGSFLATCSRMEGPVARVA